MYRANSTPPLFHGQRHQAGGSAQLSGAVRALAAATNCRPRWREDMWAHYLPKVMYRNSGYNIAVQLCAIYGLPGMNARLFEILDQVTSLLKEETAKAVRAWVKIHDITPKLAVGAPVRAKLLSGLISGHDLEQGLYYYIPDDPHIRYTDPRGIPVEYEVLDGALIRAGTPIPATGVGDTTANDIDTACGCLIPYVDGLLPARR